MSLHRVARAARNLRDRIRIDVNRRMGRELIPAVRDTLSIETSSLCNLACRFCAYPKKESARVTMSEEDFTDYIGQAVEMGLRRYQLTPCTGDVFMDRGIFDKLDFLERHPDVRDYKFFTNFTIPDAGEVDRLIRLEKLQKLNLSIYGHDRDSFVAITRSTEKVYERLIANLEHLLTRLDQRRCDLEIGFRSTRDAPRAGSTDLLALLERFARAGVRVRTSHIYNNWGGYVTQADVGELDLEINSTETYKNGACVLLFNRVQVMASGIVNGCSCRDVDATLRIGHLKERPLREILSTDNEAWMELIREQQAGHFRPVCRSCDFYKSIYRSTSAYRRHGLVLQNLDEFMADPWDRSAVSAAP